MDCTGLTDFQINAMMIIANIIAISLALMAFRFIDKKIQDKLPGIENNNARTIESFKSLGAGIIVYLIALVQALELLKNLFCPSL